MQNKLLDWVQGILLHGTWEWTHQSCYRDIVACYLASFTRCMGKRLNSILLYKCVFVCGCVFLFHTHTHTHTHCRLMWIGSGMQKFCERTKMFLSHMVSFRFQWQNRQTHIHTQRHRHTKLHTHTPTHNHLHTYINICIVFEMRNNKCDCHCCCCSSSWAVSRCCLHFC